MAEVMTAKIALADDCQECIINAKNDIRKDVDRAIACYRRWRWRNAHKCRR